MLLKYIYNLRFCQFILEPKEIHVKLFKVRKNTDLCPSCAKLWREAVRIGFLMFIFKDICEVPDEYTKC